MKKDEFLIAIEANLSEYPEPWVESIIEKYSNLFQEKEASGLKEEEIIKGLGDPYVIAQNCKRGVTMETPEEQGESKNKERHSFKEEGPGISLPDLNTIESSSKGLFQKLFKFLSFILFLIISLPLFGFLLLLFAASFGVMIAGFGVFLGVFIAPTYISTITALPKGIVIFGGLGTFSLGLLVVIGGILLLKVNLRLIKNLTRKISEPLSEKRQEQEKGKSTKLTKLFSFLMALTLIFYGVALIILNNN